MVDKLKLCCTANVFACVVAALLNKCTLQILAFHYPFSLVMSSFLLSSLGILLCVLTPMFSTKHISLKDMWPTMVAFSLFSYLISVSLKYNSILFFQMCMGLTSPITHAIERMIMKKTLSTHTVLSSFVICLGFTLALFSNIRISVLGSAAGISAATGCAIYRLIIVKPLEEENADPMQLMFYQTPLVGGIFLCAWPWVEDVSTILQFPEVFDPKFHFCIVFGAFCAAIVNFSALYIIKCSSVKIYNSLEVMKFSAVVICGFVLFDHYASWLTVVGAFVVLAGLTWYTRTQWDEINEPQLGSVK